MSSPSASTRRFAACIAAAALALTRPAQAYARTATAAHDTRGKNAAHGSAGRRADARAMLRVAQGTPQSALAFAASSAPGYETVFPAPLVVRVTGRGGAPKSLRFFCADPGCRFALSEQPDAVKRVDPRTYEVPVEDGTATLSLTLSTDAPGTFTVVARPMDAAPSRRTPEARFRLTAR